MRLTSVTYRVFPAGFRLLLICLLFGFQGYSQLAVRLVSQVQPSGCATRNGSVNLAASGGTPGYRFSMDLVNFQRSGSFTGLGPGIYTFYLIDKALDVTAVSVSLTAPCAIGLGFSYSLYVCGIGGFIKVTQSFGGQPPYQYALDNNNFGNGKNFSFLPAGMHHLYVRDATGLVLDYALPMYSLCDVTLNATLTNASCNRSDGSITVDASGGGNYQYSLDGINYQPGPLFPDLPAGIYNVTVKSSGGQTVRILGLNIRSDCPAVTATSALETCGRGDGSITATGSRGTPPYSYSVDGTNFQSGNVITGLKTGAYTLTIKDANGFIATIPVTVGSGCITIQLQPLNPTCNSSNGRITAAATAGVGPYLYSVDGTNFGTGNVFSNLPAGDYTITVKDARGVRNTATVTLNNPSSAVITPEVTAATCGDDDGIIIIQTNGGITPLTFRVDGSSFGNDNRFTALPSGAHVAYVKDADGCTASVPVTVPLNNLLPVDAGTDRTICEGTAIKMNATSAATGFAWAPAMGLSDAGILQPDAAPGSSTTYTLTVTKGVCTAQDQVTITVNPAPVADAGPDQTVCYGKAITLRGSGGIGFSWSPAEDLSDPAAADPTVRLPVTTKNYLLTVTGPNGCTSVAADTMTLTVTPPAVIFAGNDTIVAPNEPLQLMAVDVNGTGFTSWSWSPAGNLSNPSGQSPVATVTRSETFVVTGTTDAGCEGIDTINVKVISGPEIYVPNAFTPNGDGHNDVLRPVLVGIRTLSYFSVFTRNGQRIFYTRDPGNGWDGTIGGQSPSTGGYVWTVEGVDYTGKTIRRSGPVLLIR